MISDSSNLIAVDVFADQLLPVFDGSLFSRVYCAHWFPCDAFPKSDIHVFRAYIKPFLPERMY